MLDGMTEGSTEGDQLSNLSRKLFCRETSAPTPLGMVQDNDNVDDCNNKCYCTKTCGPRLRVFVNSA